MTADQYESKNSTCKIYCYLYHSRNGGDLLLLPAPQSRYAQKRAAEKIPPAGHFTQPAGGIFILGEKGTIKIRHKIIALGLMDQTHLISITVS